MKAKYIKPEMEISTIVESEILCMSLEVGEGTKGGSFDSKRRERWEEGQDLWGNDCWNRVE